ncbi:zinc ribbon domain-containing protein [Cohnella candidum]|uniref:Nucleic acid-binding protein n=1 Tax=Cohnella candidum TaxID=2674991 RepID=A0A3G3K4H6_9BACL|nr:zinc ribbon domain-containing protein [Cohnella candidum]AYQ75416.1 hypothetical protein EAV92_01155 [Cohnella candidum]
MSDALKCLRCGNELTYLKEYKFDSQNANRGLFGALFDVEERLSFDIYVCPSCRHTEFFFTDSDTSLDS